MDGQRDVVGKEVDNVVVPFQDLKDGLLTLANL
jgi:hypothetical protein